MVQQSKEVAGHRNSIRKAEANMASAGRILQMELLNARRTASQKRWSNSHHHLEHTHPHIHTHANTHTYTHTPTHQHTHPHLSHWLQISFSAFWLVSEKRRRLSKPAHQSRIENADPLQAAMSIQLSTDFWMAVDVTFGHELSWASDISFEHVMTP